MRLRARAVMGFMRYALTSQGAHFSCGGGDKWSTQLRGYLISFFTFTGISFSRGYCWISPYRNRTVSPDNFSDRIFGKCCFIPYAREGDITFEPSRNRTLICASTFINRPALARYHPIYLGTYLPTKTTYSPCPLYPLPSSSILFHIVWDFFILGKLDFWRFF